MEFKEDYVQGSIFRFTTYLLFINNNNKTNKIKHIKVICFSDSIKCDEKKYLSFQSCIYFK